MKKFLITFLLSTCALFAQPQLNLIDNSFTRPMDIRIVQDNYMFVSERAGKIYIMDYNESTWQRRNEPIVDIINEVDDYFERGTLDIEIRPTNNNNIVQLYILYTVNGDYLFGEDYIGATINRVVKYDVDILNNNAYNRQIIVGEQVSDGLPVTAGNHVGGALAFDNEGNLYISTGDGASNLYGDDAVNKGIIRPEEDILGRYKAQVVNCANGKILRVNPENGNGISDNPFYDSNNPRSPQSRVFSMGLRNPFEMEIKNDIMTIADVGSATYEEVNSGHINDLKGANFGWGLYEGFFPMDSGNSINPDENLPYNQLLFQATSFDIDPIPSNRRYTHRFPDLVYGHQTYTQIPNFVGTTLSPISIANEFSGASISGGFTNDNGEYYFGDWAQGWIRKTNNTMTSVTKIEIDDFLTPICIIQGLNNEVYFIKYNSGIYSIIEDTLTIETPEFTNENSIKIVYNLLGQYIKTIPKESNLKDNLNKGLYIIKYQNSKGSEVRKIQL